MELFGHIRFADGSSGWCKKVLGGNAVAIEYDDGSYTVLPLEHWRFDDAKYVQE